MQNNRISYIFKSKNIKPSSDFNLMTVLSSALQQIDLEDNENSNVNISSESILKFNILVSSMNFDYNLDLDGKI